MSALDQGGTEDFGLSLSKLGCKPQFRMNLADDTTRIVRHIVAETNQATNNNQNDDNDVAPVDSNKQG